MLADGDAHLQPPGVSAIERQGLGGLCCVRMDAYKLDHGERHPHKSLKTEARADKNLPAAHRRGPGIPPGSRGSHRDPGVDPSTGLRGDTFVFSTAIDRSRDGLSGGAILFENAV